MATATGVPELPVQTISDPKPADALLSEKTAALEISGESTQPPSTDASSIKGATEAEKPLEKTEEAPTIAGAESQPTVPADTQAAPTGPVFVPFPHPLASCKPQPQPELTAEQVKKYDDLLELAKAWTEVPKTSARDAEKEALTDDDRLWLTRECLLRYLRASKWDVAAAAKRVLATLTWRREYGLDKFTPDYISPENETGKQVIMGFDNDARPCLFLNPSKQNTTQTPRQIHHLVFMLERVIDLMGPGQENTALCINFMDTKRGQGASIGQGREVMSILQGHYPERLGRALISELPWYITAFFKLISPLIDPITKSKMIFNEPLVNHVPAEQLLTHFGGKLEFEYKHEIYWPALNSLCEQRRQEYHARWMKAGKQIGEHEVYLRGGDAKSLNGEFVGTEQMEGLVET